MARRARVPFTPAVLRNEARKMISNVEGSDRDRVAFRAMYLAATSSAFFYTNAQLSALAEGLKLGMNEGVR